MQVHPAFLVLHHSNQKRSFLVLRVLGPCKVRLPSLSLTLLQQPKDHMGATKENKNIWVLPPLSLSMKRPWSFGQNWRDSLCPCPKAYLCILAMFNPEWSKQRKITSKTKASLGSTSNFGLVHQSACYYLFSIYLKQLLCAFHPNSIVALSGGREWSVLSVLCRIGAHLSSEK